MAYSSMKSNAEATKRMLKRYKPEVYEGLKGKGQEPTSKSSALKMKAGGNQDAMAPKGGYKDKRKKS